MKSNRDIWSQAILRFSIVAVCGMLVGFALYQSSIFSQTMRASQFAISGITAGIAYAALKSSARRDGLAALFVWYIILTGLIGDVNSWLLILNLVYITGIAAAIFVYDYLVRKSFLHSVFRRIVVAAGCIAIGNGLIIVVLALVSFHATFAHPTSMLLHTFHNLQLGALIGLGIGVGIELAEYVIVKFDEHITHSGHVKHAS